MNITIFIFITLLKNLYANDVQTKILSVPLSRFFGIFFLPAYLDTSDVVEYREINMERNISLIFSLRDLYHFSPVNSTKIILPHNNTEVVAQEYSAMVHLNNAHSINSTKLNFYHAQGNSGKLIGKYGYAFGSKYTDTSNSIVHQLYSSKLISSLSFAFVPEIKQKIKEQIGINNLKGKLYFGGIPSQNGMKGSCNIDSNEIGWACTLSKVYFANHEAYINNPLDKAFILANHYRIHVPEEFMKYLNKTFFNDYIERGICAYNFKEIKDFHKYENYRCKCSAVNAMPDINFVIGDYTYTINITSLFLKFGSECDSIIINSDHQDWILGNAFLEQYASLFDIEKQQITLYTINDEGGRINENHDNIQEEIHSKGYNQQKNMIAIMMNCISIICLIACAVSIAVKILMIRK